MLVRNEGNDPPTVAINSQQPPTVRDIGRMLQHIHYSFTLPVLVLRIVCYSRR